MFPLSFLLIFLIEKLCYYKQLHPNPLSLCNKPGLRFLKSELFCRSQNHEFLTQSRRTMKENRGNVEKFYNIRKICYLKNDINRQSLDFDSFSSRETIVLVFQFLNQKMT